MQSNPQGYHVRSPALAWGIYGGHLRNEAPPTNKNVILWRAINYDEQACYVRDRPTDGVRDRMAHDSSGEPAIDVPDEYFIYYL